MIVDGYHFLPADRRLYIGDKREVTVGSVLSMRDPDRPLELGQHGLHGSVRLIDALTSAPGPVLCRVRLSGQVVSGVRQVCAQYREVL